MKVKLIEAIRELKTSAHEIGRRLIWIQEESRMSSDAGSYSEWCYDEANKIEKKLEEIEKWLTK